MASVKARKNLFGGPNDASIITVGKLYTIHNICGNGYDAAYEVETDRRIVEKIHRSYFDDGVVYSDTADLAVSDYAEPNTRPKIVSDGGSSDYYKVYDTDKDCQDIIERKKMGWNRGNVFKAAFRMGEKEGPDELYDWKKIKWFAEREIARLEGKGN